MRIEVDIPDYGPEGISLKWSPEALLAVMLLYDDFDIMGNKEGLQLLGSCFLRLAQDDVPSDYSLRLTEEQGLQKGSEDLIIRKDDDPAKFLENSVSSSD